MMTPKKQLFVLEYLVDQNAAQAAIRAGYSKKTANSQGSRLLTDVDIAAAIARAAQKKMKAADITSDMILEGLHREANATGEGTTQSARVRAWELLGKWQMLFVDRIEVRHSYSDMTDDELAAEFGRLRKPAQGSATH